MCRVKFKWKHCHETRKSSRTPWRPRRAAGHLASHLQPQAGGRCHQCIGRMQCPDQRRNRWLQGQWRSQHQWRTGQGSKRSPHRRMLPVVSPRWPRSKLLQFQCLWQAQTHESCEGQARRPWGMLRSTAARHRSWRGSEPSWQSEIMTSRDGLEVSGFTWAKQKKQTELIGASVSDSAVLPGMKSTGLHLCWCESLKSCTTRVTENDKQPWTRKSAKIKITSVKYYIVTLDASSFRPFRARASNVPPRFGESENQAPAIKVSKRIGICILCWDEDLRTLRLLAPVIPLFRYS